MKGIKLRHRIVTAALCLFLANLGLAEPKQELLKEIGSSIYRVYAVDKDKKSVLASASCVAITPTKLVTNCHIALNGNFLVVRVDNKPYLADICYINKKNDLCIIETSGAKLNPIQVIRPSHTTKINEEVYSISNLNGKGRVIRAGKVTNLVFQHETELIEVTNQLEQGASGGGLFDDDGCLIGITTYEGKYTGLGYAIPTELIFEAIDASRLPACRKWKEKHQRSNPSPDQDSPETDAAGQHF